MAVYEFLADQESEIKLLDYLGNPADAKGSLTEVGAPEIVRAMDTDLRLGEGGVVNRPTTFEGMESSMTLKGISPEFAQFCAVAQAKKQLLTVQLTGKGRDRYSSSVVDMKLVLKGYVTKIPLFGATAGEVAESEMTLAVNAVSQQVGTFSLYFEPGANKYEINGVNQWS